jgi:glycosyltransferase involved in cell wall biosynthesis
MTAPRPAVAIAHDYLTQRGGAERVVLTLTRAFPDAAVYTSLYDPAGTFPEFGARRVRPLWLDRIAPLRRRHRLALALLPIAWSQARIDADVVVCSSSGWAHGVRTGGRKVVYCHSPAKWLHRRDDYLGSHPAAGARLATGALTPVLERFDRRAARSADVYVANSTFIAGQIRDVYGISAAVLPPPAGLDPAGPQTAVPGLEPGFLLTVARLLPYKNVGETVAAFGLRRDARLVVVGDGPSRRGLGEGAPPNVRFVGEVDDARLRWLYANSAGLVAASREDFGLTPIESFSFGKPVAALHFGGYRDTVVPGVTGVFFERAEPAQIEAAVDTLRNVEWDAGRIRLHAASFAEDRFIEGMKAIVASAANGS